MDINAVARIDNGRIDIEQQENEKEPEKKQRNATSHEAHAFQRHTRSWGRWYGGVFSFLYSRMLHPQIIYCFPCYFSINKNGCPVAPDQSENQGRIYSTQFCAKKPHYEQKLYYHTTGKRIV
jgi:hypothetical protein